MSQSHPIPFALLTGCLLAITARAQETVVVPAPPKTRLEILETQTGTVIVKGTALIGTLTVGAGSLTVRCKEFKDVGHDRKEYGLSVTLKEGSRTEETILVDQEELEGLVAALDYLARADHTVTVLPGFDAAYKTRGELRIHTFSRKSTGGVEAAVLGSLANKIAVALPMADLAKFRTLIEQGREKLDEIIKAK
jgi:hypothetical protein